MADMENSCSSCVEEPRQPGALTPKKTFSFLNAPPLTPTANLKMLVAAAEAKNAFESTIEPAIRAEHSHECEVEEDDNGRKTRSLSVICHRFLRVLDEDLGEGKEFSLDSAAQLLDVNRRRIYDIINIFECLEMVVKQSKNWYLWLGRGNLVITLAKLLTMARDDQELMAGYESYKERSGMASAPEPSRAGEEDEPSRWDKSLGVLCQKFIMLILISPNNEVTLDAASFILVPDPPADFTPAQAQRSKVRRFYDIANVLSVLGLVRKRSVFQHHRKGPGYSWSGPSMEEINSISVVKKREYSTPLLPKTGGLSGSSLTRKPSFSKYCNRPFIHQYEVFVPAGKGPSSAPSSPVKGRSGSAGFKRSLSFGGPDSKRTKQDQDKTRARTSNSNMVPFNYFKEIRQFEFEMNKHAHKYPHVAPLFREFIVRYTTTLQSAAKSGKALLPKPSQQDTTQPPNSETTFTDSTAPPSTNRATPTKATTPVEVLPLPNITTSLLVKQNQTNSSIGRSILRKLSKLESSPSSLSATEEVTSASEETNTNAHSSSYLHTKEIVADTTPTKPRTPSVQDVIKALKLKIHRSAEAKSSNQVSHQPPCQNSPPVLATVNKENAGVRVLQVAPLASSNEAALPPSAILAGQIVNCFKNNGSGQGLSSDLLLSLNSSSQTGGGGGRVPLGVVQKTASPSLIKPLPASQARISKAHHSTPENLNFVNSAY